MKGRRPTVTLGRAKKFAERQGYRWVPNPDADMPFDAFAQEVKDYRLGSSLRIGVEAV